MGLFNLFKKKNITEENTQATENDPLENFLNCLLQSFYSLINQTLIAIRF